MTSDVNAMLVSMLRDLYADEPPQPDEIMPMSLANETAEKHYEWQRQVNGARILLGVRLVNDALEEADVAADSVYEPRCDVCNVHTEEADGWCGNCGNCANHCEQHLGCPPREDTE